MGQLPGKMSSAHVPWLGLGLRLGVGVGVGVGVGLAYLLARGWHEQPREGVHAHAAVGHKLGDVDLARVRVRVRSG